MNKQDTYKIINDIRIMFPKWYVGYTEEDILRLTAIWHSEFEVVPHNVMEECLKKAFKTLKFPPTVNDLTEMLVHDHFKGLESAHMRYSKLQSFLIHCDNRSSSYQNYKENYMNEVEIKFLTDEMFRNYMQVIKFGNSFGTDSIKKDYVTQYETTKKEIEFNRTISVGKNDMLYLDLDDTKLIGG